MQRHGRRNLPFYRISAVDERVKRDGKVIEELGWYNPIAKDESKQLKLNEERVKHWLSVGAKPSDTLMDVLTKRNLVDGEAWKKRRAWRVAAKQKAQKAAAEKGAKPAAEKKEEGAASK
jgi:small subunit ribosomal protein S16